MILTTIATGHLLDAPAAASYARMCAAYGAVIPVTSAYRDPKEQAKLRALYLAGEWPAYVAPVETSDHPKGLAVDFAAAARLWLALRAAEHGWVATDPTEWWHRVYFPARDRHLTDPVPPTTAPTHGGFLMALTDSQQLDLLNAVGRLEALLGAAGVTTGKIDMIAQAVVDIRGGVAGLPDLLATLDDDTDPEPVADRLLAVLPTAVVDALTARLVAR